MRISSNRARAATAVIVMTAAAAVLLMSAAARAAEPAPLTQDACVKILKELDYREKNFGDYKALFYMEQKEKGKDNLVYEGVIYRRDKDEKLMILFLKPKSEAGKGYLRIDKNLFMYDPTVGKWERRTERERIGGTDSRRRDFDESRLAVEYTPAYVGREKLGEYAVDHLELNAKPGIDVAFPIMHLWVEAGTNNLMKAQEKALSGKLMRTTYYPEWQKLYSQSKGGDVYVPKQIRIYDEVEKGNSTVIVIRKVDLNTLEDNIFTKAWLESKSR